MTATRAVARPRRIHGAPNKTERAYAQTLELRKLAGEIQGYDFEPIKLKLAPLTFYTPDFMVIGNEGQIEFHEVKGFMEDDAAVKIKTASVIHWYAYFYLVTRAKGGGWNIQLVP